MLVITAVCICNAAFAVSVVDFGTKGDGIADDTAAIQRAMDAAGPQGGVVRLPVGKYLVKSHLTVPTNVTLEGEWRAPARGVPFDSGSALLCVEGKGEPDGTPFITLNTNATLSGLSIFYPEQAIANPPHAYPWTVQAADGTDNCSIVNVTMINPYQAVDFGTYTTGRHYINGLYAYPLFKGLYINQCYDVGRIENIHFWPFWDLNPDSPLWAFTKEQGTAFIIGKTDGEMAFNCFSIFYHVGMHFVAGPISGQKGRAIPGSGVYTNCYMDITPCAIKVDETAATAGVSFVNGMFMSGVEVAPSNKGEVKFTACGFWANRGQSYHAKLEGRGAVFFEGCHFSNWDQAMDGTPCIDADCARLIVTGSEFNTDRTNHWKVRLGPNVRTGVITSNLMPGGVLIKNEAADSADVQIGLNAGAAVTGRVREWLILGPFPNPGIKHAGEGQPSRAGFDTDYLASIGGEAKATLRPNLTVPFASDGGKERSASVQSFKAEGDGPIDLKRLFPDGHGVAYAFCYLQSDRDQTARIELGANDCSKVWVNGALVHRLWDAQGGDSTPGAYTFDAPLKKGMNSVLVKVEDAGGRRWEFVFEAYGKNGNPLKAALQ